MSVTTKEFIENSKLDVLIPQATGFDIEEAFANNDEHVQADIISLIEQRALLYFGGYLLATLDVLWSYSFLGSC
jgi:hypothetical protein